MKKTRKVCIVDTPKKYMAEGGEGFEEIQAELGEIFMMPDFQLVDTKATEKHKDMDNYEITDELVKGSFVFSNSKKNLLDLKSLADEKVAKGVSYYQEGSNYKKQDMYLSDYLPKTKKKITYADAADSIRRKIKLEDLDDESKDPYTRQTNEMNKETRGILLSKLIELQESNKDKPKKYELGGNIMADGGMPGIEDLILKFKSSLDGYEGENEANYAKSVQDYKGLNNKLGLLNAASLIGNTLFTGAQKTLVEPAYQSSSLADSMFKSIAPAALKESNESRRGILGASANQLLAAGADPSKVSTYLAPMTERILDAEGDASFKALQYQTDMDNAKSRFRSQILNENIKEGATAQRATDDNSNKAISILGKGVDSFIDNLGKGAVDNTTNLRKALSEYNTNRLSLMKSKLGMDTSLLDYNQRKSELDFKRKQFEESLNIGKKKPSGILNAPVGTNSKSGVGMTSSKFDKSNTLGTGSVGSNLKNIDSATVDNPVIPSKEATSNNDHILRYRDMSDGLFKKFEKANSSGLEDDYQDFLTEVRKYIPDDKFAQIEQDLHSGKIKFSPSTIGIGPAVGALYDSNGDLVIPLDIFKNKSNKNTKE